MGSRCYDDTRLIGCGGGWVRGEGKKRREEAEGNAHPESGKAH